MFMMHLLSWTSLLFGIWILVFSLIVWGSDRIFPVSPAVLTVLRMITIIIFSLLVALIERVVVQGISIG